MAGSYNHITNDAGGFDGVNFHGMIENLGDAYEACEMMHFMIRYLAGEDEDKIEAAQEAYYSFKS